MSFTKVTSAGIGSTELVTLDSLEVINNASIGGVLTYEDVTNVDSIGIVTARAGVLVGSGITLSKDGDVFATGITTVSGNVKVGTGITLSPDGDVFFTGIATGNGSGLTALNASNLGSGTVPTARLGSGTASSSTFLRGDSTFQTVNTDLVSDTTPQLGGNLDVNTKNILFGDSGSASDDRLQFGASQDLNIFHDGSNSYVRETGTGDLYIECNSKIYIGKASGGAENGVVYNVDGSVDLYYDNSKKLETASNGGTLTGDWTVTNDLFLNDNGEAVFGNGGDFKIFHDGSNSYVKTTNTNHNLILEGAHGVDVKHGGENMAKFRPDSYVELFYDNASKFVTTSTGIKVNNRVEIIANAIVDNTAQGNNVGILFASAAILPATGSGSLTDASKDLGSSSYRWRNIYTNDLQLSNKGSTNSVDNTWGDYTIQEGESDLFLINNRSGKKYKFNLTEVS